MSFFPTTRLGRALVMAVVVSGVAVVLPFLLAVVRMTGDVTTELPPLEPEGTPTAILLANPVAWFLVVTVAAWLVLAVVDLVRHVRRRRSHARRPSTRRPATRATSTRRPTARTATRTPARATSRKTPARATSTRTTSTRTGSTRTGSSRAPRQPSGSRPRTPARPASRR